MNISTVAVYSEVDSDAQHVRLADEAICIGPALASQSYLNIEALLHACKRVEVDAVHPGYGFLSEKADFALALQEAGIAFIGPHAKAIAAMGDKIESKKLAQIAGVRIVPGFVGAIVTPDDAKKIAEEIGYPVIIKASAGGGGKGMRIAQNETDLQEGVRGARSEAQSSFADDRIFIEKYIEHPRHIEIQILADKYGNAIHLGERECSIQRRHQKVIEEAPSPILDAPLRAEMGRQALALARAVGYDSAGTIEFVMDQERNFYFLEMNTRLQVEHPVTEMVTGQDLVEWMIRIAAGEKLTLSQSEIKWQGFAIEARIYAEDPLRGFLPSIGRLTRYREPEGIRVDSGVYEGAEISIHYDPMIAKAIAYAQTREEAARQLSNRLERFQIKGLNHNIPFLQALLTHKNFQSGELSTDFITNAYPDGFHGAFLSLEQQEDVKSVLIVLRQILAERDVVEKPSFANGKPIVRGTWAVALNEENKWERRQVVKRETHWEVSGGKEDHSITTSWRPSDSMLVATINGREMIAQIERRNGMEFRLTHAGAHMEVRILTWRAAELATLMPQKKKAQSEKYLLSPMPGLLSKIFVQEGDRVKAGQELCIIEAMKMENVLRADHDGKVEKFHVASGETLAADQIILEFV